MSFKRPQRQGILQSTGKGGNINFFIENAKKGNFPRRSSLTVDLKGPPSVSFLLWAPGAYSIHFIPKRVGKLPDTSIHPNLTSVAVFMSLPKGKMYY